MNAAKVGDWGRAQRAINKLSRTGVDAVAVVRTQAELSKNRIKRNIERQVYDWPGPSPNSRPLDPRLLIETGQYVDAIDVVQFGPLMFGVGIPRGTTNDKGVDLGFIGMAHEYGYGNLPPRPHWRREYRVFRTQLAIALSAMAKTKVSLRQ